MIEARILDLKISELRLLEYLISESEISESGNIRNFKHSESQNYWNRKKTTKSYFIEVVGDLKYKTGPQKNQEKGNKLL